MKVPPYVYATLIHLGSESRSQKISRSPRTTQFLPTFSLLLRKINLVEVQNSYFVFCHFLSFLLARYKCADRSQKISPSTRTQVLSIPFSVIIIVRNLGRGGGVPHIFSSVTSPYLCRPDTSEVLKHQESRNLSTVFSVIIIVRNFGGCAAHFLVFATSPYLCHPDTSEVVKHQESRNRKDTSFT